MFDDQKKERSNVLIKMIRMTMIMIKMMMMRNKEGGRMLDDQDHDADHDDDHDDAHEE